jgi:hypothetical protein
VQRNLNLLKLLSVSRPIHTKNRRKLKTTPRKRKTIARAWTAVKAKSPANTSISQSN